MRERQRWASATQHFQQPPSRTAHRPCHYRYRGFAPVYRQSPLRVPRKHRSRGRADNEMASKTRLFKEFKEVCGSDTLFPVNCDAALSRLSAIRIGYRRIVLSSCSSKAVKRRTSSSTLTTRRMCTSGRRSFRRERCAAPVATTQILLLTFAAWRCAIQGPTGTPYEGGNFQVSIRVPEQYPLTPPVAKFVTKVSDTLSADRPEASPVFKAPFCARTTEPAPNTDPCRFSTRTFTSRRVA